jgi:hypothetical protein
MPFVTLLGCAGTDDFYRLTRLPGRHCRLSHECQIATDATALGSHFLEG